MGNTLDNLKKLASTANTIVSYNDDTPVAPIVEKKKKSKKRVTHNMLHIVDEEESLEEYLASLDERLEKYGVLDDEDFDMIMDSIDVYDEDLELKTTLVGMGRKYARANKVSESESEIDKAFAANEQSLRNILEEVNKDVLKLEKDLDTNRTNSFGRSAVKIAELASAKNSLHSTRLSIIKELNNVAKSKIELKAKTEKAINGNDDSYIANNIMQQIFGMGRGAVISENSTYNDNDYYDDESADPAISAGESMCDEYDKQHEENEGDLYLKYEGKNINVVAEYDTSSGTYRCYAEDEDGNIIDDYPVPKDPSQLSFDVNTRAGTAVDHLQRPYIYREI